MIAWKTWSVGSKISKTGSLDLPSTRAKNPYDCVKSWDYLLKVMSKRVHDEEVAGLQTHQK